MVSGNSSEAPSSSRQGVTVLDMQGQSSMQLQSIEDDVEEMSLVFKKGRSLRIQVGRQSLLPTSAYKLNGYSLQVK